ncbi:Colicin V secretion protein CvaA [Polaribacter huanghezhanensis]|uniref:HlyD family secretion protein n=1 Tax=Polaribacter huanghezhanensis TaxID=1354726 RepID=UPI002648C924|nr:HlyD family efflux transporter periplasmic adaptor subunit [Polaribacter huanghezhanensis]WKD85754.1 Colicin V secretion protein CvaA [Polaribacter huanghezhanensis]
MPENNQDIEVRSEEVQEILTQVPNWMIRWGNTLFFLLIVMVLFISWFVKYPDVISTQVMITTTIPPEKIYAKTSGQIEVLLKNDGDKIEKNETIAIIENSANYKDVFLLKSILDTLSINTNNFSFPINSIPYLVLGDITTSYATFENNYSEYYLNNKLNPYKNQSFANQFSLVEAKGRFQVLKSQKELNLRELQFKQKDLARQKQLFEKGVISAKDYEQKQIEILQAEKSYKSLESSISQTRELINNSQKDLKSTSIEKTLNDTRLLKKTIQSYYQLKKSIKDWEKQFVLKSSIKGKVTFLSFWSENQTVQTGNLVFTIIPIKNSSYVGKINAPAANSGKIKKGQRVQIKLANFPSDEFGEINGRVKTISIVPDEKGNYLIDVALPKKLITTYGRTIEFKQEMKGTAEIVTEDLRLIERFFYQLKNILK